MKTARVNLVAFLALVPVAVSGCAQWNGERSARAATPHGDVRMLDRPTRAHMHVVEQKVEFTAERRLVVSVRWLNRARKLYRSEIRVGFFDAQDLPERGAFTWDLQSFPPGECMIEWTSYTRDAVRYRIEVRSAH